MITKQDIIKMAKHVVRKANNVPDQRLMHPVRDWIIGLVFFLLLATVGVLYSADRFTQFSSLEQTIEQDDTKVKQLNTERITKVLEEHKARGVRFLELSKNVAPAPEQQATSSVERVSQPDETEAVSDFSEEPGGTLTPDGSFEI